MPVIPALRTLEKKDVSGLQANPRNMAVPCLKGKKMTAIAVECPTVFPAMFQ